MEAIKRIIRHGDVALCPMDSAYTEEDVYYRHSEVQTTVLARGSNGGLHLIRGDFALYNVQGYSLHRMGLPESVLDRDELARVLFCREDCELRHSRDDHRTVKVPRGVYFVLPQREWEQPRVID